MADPGTAPQNAQQSLPTAPPTQTAVPAQQPTSQPVVSAVPTPTVVPAEPTTMPTAPAVRAIRTAVTSAATPARGGGGGASGRKMLGYYVPYDTTSWRTLEKEAARLDYISAQWVDIDRCGGITSRDDRTLIAFARARGIPLFPSLLTGDDDLNHQLLTDKASRDNAVAQIVAYVMEMGYEGFDLDLENIDPADRHVYSAFVAQLAAALHKQGKLLMAALPAKAYDATTGWAGAFDYAAIGQHLDLAMIMTYDYSWSTGPAGSIAPKDWLDKVMAYVTKQMPAEKVLLGVAFYGYDWNVSSGGRARALRFDQAAALAAKYGAKIDVDPATQSGTFRYRWQPGDQVPATAQPPALSHEISGRKAPACAKQAPTATPRPPATPTRPPTGPQEHVVWIEEARSVEAALKVADKNRVHGIGTWRLGQEDPGIWPLLATWR